VMELLWLLVSTTQTKINCTLGSLLTFSWYRKI
jgi:hypothetical protein